VYIFREPAQRYFAGRGGARAAHEESLVSPKSPGIAFSAGSAPIFPENDGFPA
jgi:hypothetical protein